MTAIKSKRNNKNHVLYDDVEKIKAAIADATFDMKDRVGEMVSESLGSVKEQSAMARENLSNYTAERPIKSLSLALFAGLIIGYFIHK